MTQPFRIRVNGATVAVDADPLDSLSGVLGGQLALHSVREPCGLGACGACTVLVDGQPVRSCLRAVGLIGDAAVTTVEGLPSDDPVVTAFAASNAFQCAYCTPGFVMATIGLLAADPAPDLEGVRETLAGNLCRCGSYSLILEAVSGLLPGASETPPDAL